MSDTAQIYISESDFRNRYQYSQKDLLGEGGFAQVYRAFDRQFKEYVALKFFNKGEEGKYDVLHEMKDSRKFSHKNIIRIHDAIIVKFDHTWGHSLVQVGILEYADGGNLRDFIGTAPSESQFLDVLVSILNALEYLHKDKKIIHRDLSPENILMFVEDDNWIPKIADFGISKKIDIVSDAKNQQKSTLLLGKVTYMAPEQFYPEKFGIRGAINTNVDLWSFGVILYELFTHKAPFGSDSQDNPLKIIQSITNDPIPYLDEIPLPYSTVIKRCLEKDANSRVKSAGELVSILNKTPSETEPKPKKVTTIPIRHFKQNRVKRNIIFLSVTAGLILIIAGYFIFRPETRLKPDRVAAGITSLIKQKKFYLAIDSVSKLPDELKSQIIFIDLVKQARDSIQSFRVDSLMNLGNQSFLKNDYTQAIKFYNKVVTDYDLADVLAQSKIKKINAVKDSIEKSRITATPVPLSLTDNKNGEEPILPVNKHNTDIQYSITIKNPPDCEGIKLLGIISSDKNTIITLQFSLGSNSYKIFGSNHEDAYYIEYTSKNGKSQMRMKGLETEGGIETGKVIRSGIVRLIYDRLPDDVNNFDLIQGRERMDESILYCHFRGIYIKKKTK
jgi:serine/threonine protein kinase